MPQINATITPELAEKLQKIAQKTNKSFSKIVSDMAESGLKVYEKQHDYKSQKAQTRARELEAKHSEYLLRLININSEILRKLYNEKPKYEADNTNELLNVIKKNVQKYATEKDDKKRRYPLTEFEADEILRRIEADSPLQELDEAFDEFKREEEKNE